MWKIIAGDQVGARAGSVNKFTSFCYMSVTSSLLHLGALLRDNLQIVAFS